MADPKDNRDTEVEKDSGGKTSGITVRDDGDTIHTTSFVDIPGVGSLRSSFDEDKVTGEITNQHMTNQS